MVKMMWVSNVWKCNECGGVGLEIIKGLVYSSATSLTSSSWS